VLFVDTFLYQRPNTTQYPTCTREDISTYRCTNPHGCLEPCQYLPSSHPSTYYASLRSFRFAHHPQPAVAAAAACTVPNRTFCHETNLHQWFTDVCVPTAAASPAVVPVVRQDCQCFSATRRTHVRRQTTRSTINDGTHPAKKHAMRCFTSHRKEALTGAPLLRPRAARAGYLTSPGARQTPFSTARLTWAAPEAAQGPPCLGRHSHTHLPIAADPARSHTAHAARRTHCTPQLHCAALHAALCVRFPLRPAPPPPPPPRTDHSSSALFAASPGPWIRHADHACAFLRAPPAPSMHEVISRAAL
jgi:hypothetical protein